MQVAVRPTALKSRSLVAGGALQEEKAQGALSVWYEVQFEVHGDCTWTLFIVHPPAPPNALPLPFDSVIVGVQG
jgi:hypothetical protein